MIIVSTHRVERAFEAAWKVISRAVADDQLPSAVFAVAGRDELIRIAATGPAQGSWRPTTDSIYLLASISKPIVATAILQLVDAGQVLLNEPVANLWPEFAVNHKDTVTLWHLLTHTSGLDESDRARNGIPQDGARAWDVAAVRDTSLSFVPGSRYRYCNAAFRAMVTLVERLTGRDYVDILAERVLAPIGMADTSFAPSADSGRVAPVLDCPFVLDDWVGLASPSGGYWSTATDLVAFGQMWLKQGSVGETRVLSSASVRAATRVQYEGTNLDDPIQPAPIYRGLGFSIRGPGRTELLPVGSYGHGGATGTQLWIDPINALVLVFLTNRWGQPAQWRDRALNAFYGEL